ncbi:MAG: bifunctional 2-C-methyl-D-erythritol 4-phosphate cytidylyltransferase/2-C-methyl-D-erythritol 2,4-cyclodiphosphate synthase [Alphaproteobacteria bacterium]|nr:MAG: bifunctional 2-C-methyl-D-erythritol 4-phosphate cytidylyltransferase/2-C-methyl-D-erythritol 2,4-cyclodiphosphate synthase [Alphaproteobacteria bacterium]
MDGGRTVGLVVAAGSGTRVGGDIPKQYRSIAGKAVLAHAVDRMTAAGVARIIVVVGQGQEELAVEALGGRPLPAPVTGGATRRQSVLNGLEAIAEAGGADEVLIHDAARPFLPAAVVQRLTDALASSDGAVPVLPLVDSIARAGATLDEPVAREGLVRVQTPQAFLFEPILAAHRGWNGAEEPTDDAQVARAAGLAVATVEGDSGLEKLTFEEDFERAERRLAATLVSRTGLGFDVHAFAPGTSIWLGGVEIPHDRSLKGHSDADVLLHALTDAILGAIGAGDIGDHFPPSDPQWRGAASSIFLEHARSLVEARGGIIDHVDATIICEAPRIGPHRDAIRARVAALLRLSSERVSIKATTTERLGFTGRGEGIAAQAIATVRLPSMTRGTEE